MYVNYGNMKTESMERLLINFCKYCSDVFLKFKNRKNLFINYFWFLTLSPDIKPARAILTNHFTTQVKRNQLFWRWFYRLCNPNKVEIHRSRQSTLTSGSCIELVCLRLNAEVRHEWCFVTLWSFNEGSSGLFWRKRPFRSSTNSLCT